MLPLKRLVVYIRHPLAAWAILRIITSGAAAYALRFVDGGITVPVPGYAPPGFEGLGRILSAPWLRADALWYLKISRQGYAAHDGTIAFSPAYPAMVSFIRPLFAGNEVLAGLFVSSVATLAGLILLYRFVETIASRDLAVSAVWGVAMFPASFFLLCPYGEGLFLLFTGWALYACVRGRPVEAALVGAFAALTRPFGFILCVALLLLGWKRMAWKKALFAATGPLAGLGMWLVFAARVTGDPLGGLAVQARWQREPAFFLATIAEGVRSWLNYRHSDLGPYFLLDIAATLFGLALVALVFKVFHSTPDAFGLGGFGSGAMLLPLSSVFGPRPLLSMPRFVLALAPLFLALGVLPRSVRIALAGVGAAGTFALTVAFVSARPIF